MWLPAPCCYGDLPPHGAAPPTHTPWDGRTERQTDRQTDGRTEGRTEGWTDGQQLPRAEEGRCCSRSLSSVPSIHRPALPSPGLWLSRSLRLESRTLFLGHPGSSSSCTSPTSVPPSVPPPPPDPAGRHAPSLPAARLALPLPASVGVSGTHALGASASGDFQPRVGGWGAGGQPSGGGFSPAPLGTSVLPVLLGTPASPRGATPRIACAPLSREGPQGLTLGSFHGPLSDVSPSIFRTQW